MASSEIRNQIPALDNSIQNLKFPTTVKYIVANEFCERFSFYGMRAILALYLKNALDLSITSATETVHLFIVASYFTPLLGAFLSDCFLGKYVTILSLSLVYCIGNWTISFSAFEASHASKEVAWYWVITGLGLIALGTGGIKPCVSAFGGDQIEQSAPPGSARDTLLRSFFSAFYFSINGGAALSMIVTPWLHSNFSYTTAFATPACLMLLAVVFFVIGSSGYAHQPPTGNLLVSVGKIIIAGLSRKWKQTRGTKTEGEMDLEHTSDSVNQSLMGNQVERVFLVKGGSNKRPISAPSSPEGTHWLDYAKEAYNVDDVEDVKQLLRVLWLFLPAPIFWSLFDQQASRWVFQAEHLDGRLPLGLQIEPEQMQTLNSVSILILIPVFDRLIYPAVDRFGGSLRPIRRMVMGMILCSAAFVLSGILQYFMEEQAAVPSASQAQSRLSMLWQMPQYFVLTAGEIMFSITGLELAYSQAPSSMTSVVTSGWLLTVSAGNLVTVVLVALIGERISQMEVYFLFSIGNLLAMLGLLWVGRGFVYVESVQEDVQYDTTRASGGHGRLEDEEEHSLSTTGI